MCAEPKTCMSRLTCAYVQCQTKMNARSAHIDGQKVFNLCQEWHFELNHEIGILKLQLGIDSRPESLQALCKIQQRIENQIVCIRMLKL